MSEESKRTTIGKAIQDFLSFHEMNKDSADTMKNYRISLRRFAVWLSSVGVIYVDELALSHLRAWVSHCKALFLRKISF